MKVYFISGLGADSRIFKHIQLPEGNEMVHLDWIEPVKNESLESYSLRLGAGINSAEPFVLLGLSMGGMIAAEIAKKYPPAITILLSSVPTFKQLPGYYKIAYFLRLHKMVPVKLLKSASILKRYFYTDTSEDKAILRQVIRDTDPAFIRWALGAILQWRNEIIPDPLWHIHGTRDEIIPVRFTKPTHLISKGSHLMVMSRAGELNELLKEALS